MPRHRSLKPKVSRLASSKQWQVAVAEVAAEVSFTVAFAFAFLGTCNPKRSVILSVGAHSLIVTAEVEGPAFVVAVALVIAFTFVVAVALPIELRLTS
jgi:hypothetical protein